VVFAFETDAATICAHCVTCCQMGLVFLAGIRRFPTEPANPEIASFGRFKWPENPHVKFSPAVGHLLAGATKRVTATFLSAAPLKLDGQELRLQVAQIQYKGQPADWDDVIAATAAAVAAATAASAPNAPAPTTPRGGPAPAAMRSGAGGKAGVRGSGASTAGGAGGAAAAAALPGGEPLHDVVPKTQKDLILKVRRFAGSGRMISRQIPSTAAQRWASVCRCPCCASPTDPLENRHASLCQALARQHVISY
jgi:hypothetical protein